MPKTFAAKFVPAAEWLRRYTGADAAADAIAAVIVTIMLIPQSLAYAMLAGLPPEVGLYASMAPLIAYALFGSSRTLAVGPVAVVSLMTAAAVGKIAAPGSPEYLGAALTLAFLSGLILIAVGLLRLGFLANLLSHPVISGFITASGILIAASQLKHILGVPVAGDTIGVIGGSLFSQVGAANFPTLTIGVAAIAFLLWARSFFKPTLHRLGIKGVAADIIARAGPIVAVIVSILAVNRLGLEGAGVNIVGSIPRGLPPIAPPAVDWSIWRELLPAAIFISIIGFVESVSVAQTLAAKRRERIEPNQELVGLGAANLAAGVTGGFPVTGGFSRSVVNFDAGAKTAMTGVFTAIGIGLTALYLTPLFYHLPNAVLAATIIVAVLSLVDLRTIQHTFIYSKTDFAAMAATILLTLGSGVEVGVMAGVALSLVLHIWRTSRPHVAIVGKIPGTEHFRNVLRHNVETDSKILLLRIDESLYFANARFLEDLLIDRVAEQPSLNHVVLICSAVNIIDASALESLERTAANLRDAGVTLHLAEVKGPVMDRLERVGFPSRIKPGRIFLSTHEAFLALRNRPAPAHSTERAAE